MIYPPEFEVKIGFDQIRELLNGLCLSDVGKSEVKNMVFSSDHNVVTMHLARTEEFRQILLSGDPFPLRAFNDLSQLSHRLRIENTFPEPEELDLLRSTLVIFIGILEFFTESRKVLYPALGKLLFIGRSPEAKNRGTGVHEQHGLAQSGLTIASTLSEIISRVLDEKARIRNSASKELARIRQETLRLQAGVHKRMNQIFGEARKNGWTDEDAEVTIREGRPVIPFRCAHKRKIQGVVHDESATGQTVYVEPVELFEMNNSIRELNYAERREIIRILTGVADQIRPHIPFLNSMNRLLGMLDFIRAKSMLAIMYGGSSCREIIEEPQISWNVAYHPLLSLSFIKAGRQVVPQEISLTPGKRVLVISGPNAGGKSICLKTVGLLQYMVQCGLLPSVREDSGIGIFNKIMIDIGDEQSLENDLSTYTSKLLHMKFMIGNLDERSLFLIDEMGTGTDPSIGGAIAEAALRSMTATGAWGVVTTHYANLKLLASQIPDPGILNGAMLFDTRTMKPLYKLKIGKPGSSFAIEIARNIGFPEAVLDNASELTGGSQLDFEKQLQELEQEKEEVSKKGTEVKVADEFLGELIIRYERKISDLERTRNEILDKAREEARQLLEGSNKLIERTIREIRESQAEKERTKAARSAIRDARSAMTPKSSGLGPGKPCLRLGKPEGDILPSGLSPNTLKEADPLPFRVESGRGESGVSHIITGKQESFRLTLDLRGKRAEEAITEVQKFIDDAILLSVKEVRILHGKGTGTLRDVTRNYLRGMKEVKAYRDEIPELGGAGITVVNFKNF